MSFEVFQEWFSAGRRFWRADGKAGPNTAEEWLLSKRALDDVNALVRVIDLPSWFQSNPEAVRGLLAETCVGVTDDEKDTPKVWGIDGIEVGEDTYEVGACSIRWRASPNRERFRGQVLLARLEPHRLGSVGFQYYLLRLNWSIRYARIACCDEGVAARVVFPAGDGRWRLLATRVLEMVVHRLQPQIAWWSAPAESLADLFESAQIGVGT